MSSSGRSAGRPSRSPISSTTHRDRVRQLVAHALQGGLADQLGDDRLLGRVGQLALGVERRALRAAGRPAGPRAARPGRRTSRRPARSPATPCRSRRRARRRRAGARPSCSGVDEVGLGRRSRTSSCAGPWPSSLTMNRSPGPTFSLAGKQTATTSTSAQVGGHQVVEPLAEQRARPVQAGGVDQDQLRVGPVHDAADDGPGGLRPRGGDRDLATPPARWSGSTCRRWADRRRTRNRCGTQAPGDCVITRRREPHRRSWSRSPAAPPTPRPG